MRVAVQRPRGECGTWLKPVGTAVLGISRIDSRRPVNSNAFNSRARARRSRDQKGRARLLAGCKRERAEFIREPGARPFSRFPHLSIDDN